MTFSYRSVPGRRPWPALILAALTGLASNAHAAGCNNASLSGAYVVVGTGIRITFNGKGALSGLVQDVSSGAFQTYAGSGKYSVKSTCLVTLNVQSAVGSSIEARMWLYDLDTQGKSSLAYGASGKALIDHHSSGTPFVIARQIGRK